MKNKLKQAISILLIELIILLPIAIADSLTISNVRVEDITESSANVKWETDKPAEGGVNFGKDTSLGEEELKAGYAITEHSVPLTNLEDDTKYYFEVKANYGTEEFKDDNSGNLYDFTTLPKKELFVEASVPEHYNGGHKIDITGESIKGAEINIYANGEAAGMLAAGSDGRFVFYDVALKEEENTIKLTAESGGKKVEKSYKINVDTAEPVVEIEEIPDIVGEEKITIKGKVNEKANISFYVKKEGDATPPGKVMNLAATSVEANRIELSWNKTEAEDFEAYIIYRDNKAIALIPDIGYTDYSDVMVNSDREYAYEAAVIDLGGNIGERSDTLTVNSLEGGLEDRKEPAEVDIAKEVSGLQKTITAEAEFEEEIEIGKEDGFYRMRIVAADPAGNEWIYERAGNDALLLDTKDPEIEIIYPKSDASIYESYADSVTIRGKTEPGARVYLYVSRSPLEGLEEGEEAGITTLVEADLRTDENCRLNIGDEEQCRKRADYEAVADAEGYFEFEDVDLTSILGGGLRMREYETGEDSPDLAEEDDQKDENTVESRLMFIAVDAAGRKGTAEISYNVATCWSTDLTWDVTPLPEYQSPTFLNVERLKEGTEEIYFYFNFTYHGVGKNTINTRVTRLSVNDACGSGYLENRERYEYSCDILGSCTSKLSPNGRTAYVACSLNSLEGVENWAEDDWDGFIEAVKEEMTFPFKLTIEYDEEQDDGKIDSKTHYLCTEIGYIVDAARIDPRDVLPDWLLYDAVDFLESSIENIDGWLDKIGEILQWTAFGCMVSFLTKFVVGIYRRVVCHYDSFSRRAAKALGSMEGGAEQEEKCKTCLREYEGGENGEAMKRYNANKDFQDIISDTCLKECYPQCDSAWSKEEALYKTYRWACDRVFGHAAPSKWTETASDDELFQKVTAGTGCANDQSVRGKPVRAISCGSVENKYPSIQGRYGADDKCLEITTQGRLGGESSLYHIDKLYSTKENKEKIYVISIADNSRPVVPYTYAIKQTEENYLVPMEQTCEQICKGELTGERVQIGLQTTTGGKVELKDKGKVKSKELDIEEDGKNYIMTYGCITPNQCISYTSGETKKINVEGEEKDVDVKTAIPMGYTSDCFAPEYVSGDSNKRIECCCINSQGGAINEYFQPGDIENKNGDFSGDYEDMEWSYRYYQLEKKGGYKNKRYNPNRYIEGRDIMACFGQNHILYDGFSEDGDGKLLVIDPMEQHIAAFQCLAISQIRNRLLLLRNMMGALKTCLLQIRTTGEADAGVCKEIFTQYICAFIWKIITWARDGCLPFGKGVDWTGSDNRVLEFVSVGMKGMWDSVADSQQELASEYGNAQLNNLIGLGEEDVFRKVCLAAFGYDWEISLDSLVDASYQSPYATLVQAVLPSREYLTFDPVTYNAKYEYRASWLINPGCDLEGYKVELACVTRNDMYNHPGINCAKQADPYGKNCDCLDLKPEDAPSTLMYYQSTRGIGQNELQDIDSTQISGRIKNSPYRYDHLRFKLDVDRDYVRNRGDVAKCFPTGHEDGVFYFPITDFTAREVAGCTVDVTTGRFSCQGGASFFYEQGNAWIREIKIEEEVITDLAQPKGVTYMAGDGKYISATIGYEKDDRKQCLIARLMDNEGFIKKAIAPIELRKGEMSGEVSTRNIYRIEEGDVSSEGYGFRVEYIDENGEHRSAATLVYTAKKAEKTGYGGMLVFRDNPNNGAGISISSTSTDTYSYRGDEKEIRECYKAGNWCTIKLEDMEAEINVRSVDPTPNGDYKFYISPTAGAGGTTLEPRFYLHIDLRHPLTADGSCDDVKGPEHDADQLIVSNGRPQSVDIPIYVISGKTQEDKCENKYARDPIREDDNYCICGEGNRKNCPKEDLIFCYGMCRKYIQCRFNEDLNYACVCDPDTPEDKYDCGWDKDGKDGSLDGVNREGWYCSKIDGKAECTKQRAEGVEAVPEDNTDLKVTLKKPDPEPRTEDGKSYYVYTKGAKIGVFGEIEDDIISKEERYEIVVRTDDGNRRDVIKSGKNEDGKRLWEITGSIDTNNYDPGTLWVYIIGKDDSQEISSKIAEIKIEASTE